MAELAREPTLPSLEEPKDRLMWLRLQLKIPTASEAARRFGWNENTYRSHENGERIPSRKTAAKYAARYKTTVAWILHGDRPPASPVDPEVITLWEGLTADDREEIKRIMRRFARTAA